MKSFLGPLVLLVAAQFPISAFADCATEVTQFAEAFACVHLDIVPLYRASHTVFAADGKSAIVTLTGSDETRTRRLALKILPRECAIVAVESLDAEMK